MFSQELENLIQATLEDGMLEEYEKAALVKRAQAEGVDLTELEIYINSILQKRQKEIDKERNVQMQKKAQEKKEAFGRTCPSCGKQVAPMTLKCECGYEFTTEKRTSSVEVLMEKINDIRSSLVIDGSEKDRSAFSKLIDPMNVYGAINLKTNPAVIENDRRVAEVINMFPVPNTKEDIIEFLTLAVTNAKKKGGIMGTILGRLKVLVPIVLVLAAIAAIWGGGNGAFLVIFYGLVFVGLFAWKFDPNTLRWNKNAEVWRSKFDQVVLKGRSLRGDPDFQKQLDYYTNLVNQQI